MKGKGYLGWAREGYERIDVGFLDVEETEEVEAPPLLGLDPVMYDGSLDVFGIGLLFLCRGWLWVGVRF